MSEANEGRLERQVGPVAFLQTNGTARVLVDVSRPLDADDIALGWAQQPLYAIPEGWALVPKVATQEMSDAGRAALAAGGSVPLAKVYRLMVAAAPTPNAL